MNRLKRYIALVLIAAMTLTAAACGKKEKPAPVRETPAAETEAKAAETEAKEAKTEETKAETETK